MTPDRAPADRPFRHCLVGCRICLDAAVRLSRLLERVPTRVPVERAEIATEHVSRTTDQGLTVVVAEDEALGLSQRDARNVYCRE